MPATTEALNIRDFVKTGSEFKRSVDLKPFQPGFMDTNNNKAAGLFGDGKGAFHLMGNWLYGSQQKNSTSGKGIADEDLGFIRFPVVKGGKGKANDTFGGINGWLVTKDAPAATTKWLKFLLNKEKPDRRWQTGTMAADCQRGQQRRGQPVHASDRGAV